MKHRTPDKLLLAAFAALVLALSAYAQEPAATPEPSRPNLRQLLARQQNPHPLQRWLRNQMNLLKKLDLTQEQDQQLRAIPVRREAEWKELNRQTVRTRRALNELLLQSEVATPEIITQRARAVGVAEARFTQLVAEIWNEVKQVLTPEQLQRLNQLRIKQLEQFQQRRQMIEPDAAAPSDTPRPLDQRRLLKRQNKLPDNRPARTTTPAKQP